MFRLLFKFFFKTPRRPPAIASIRSATFKWARKTLRALERALRRKGFKISFGTIRRLLRERGYAIRVNRKRLTKKRSPQRDRPMRYLVRLRHRFCKAGQPVISVDAKKPELVGNFKNAGGTWRRQARAVLEYDFPSDAEGVAIPLWNL